MRLFLLAALLFASGYQEESAKWRANYDAGLRASDGWLALTGLQWLHEGSNAVEGISAGTLRLQNRTVTWIPAAGKGEQRALKPDNAADTVNVGTTSLTIIERGGQLGVRLRDPKAKARVQFHGTRWFPASEAWRIHAKWSAYAKPKSMQITNILGMTMGEPSPGYASFTLKGVAMRLDPVIEDGHLFFMFRDKTNSRDTYGAGRFLNVAIPLGSEVELDFNQAHNPPCAFTPYATCPIPPRQNTLPIPVEAGEKRYESH